MSRGPNARERTLLALSPDSRVKLERFVMRLGDRAFDDDSPTWYVIGAQIEAGSSPVLESLVNLLRPMVFFASREWNIAKPTAAVLTATALALLFGGGWTMHAMDSVVERRDLCASAVVFSDGLLGIARRQHNQSAAEFLQRGWRPPDCKP